MRGQKREVTKKNNGQIVGQREFRCNRLGMYYNLTVVRIFSPSLGGAPVNRQYLGAWHRVAPRVSTLSLLLLAASAIESIGAPTPSILWNQSFGSSSKDLGTGISLDGLGNLYITGITPAISAGRMRAARTRLYGSTIRTVMRFGLANWVRLLTTTAWRCRLINSATYSLRGVRLEL